MKSDETKCSTSWGKFKDRVCSMSLMLAHLDSEKFDRVARRRVFVYAWFRLIVAWVCQTRSPQRLTSRFSNIKGEDIKLMCITTPANIYGIAYDRPSHCNDKVCPSFLLKLLNRSHDICGTAQGIFGMYGEWEVEDAKCVRK